MCPHYVRLTVKLKNRELRKSISGGLSMALYGATGPRPSSRQILRPGKVFARYSDAVLWIR
jgi:hypothetical protein